MKKLVVASYSTAAPAQDQLDSTQKRGLLTCVRQSGAERILYYSRNAGSLHMIVRRLPESCPPWKSSEADPGFRAWCGAALTEESEPIRRFQEAAAELSVGIVITAFTKGVKYPQNSAFVIGRDGQILMKYSKVHTCDFDWERYLESGSRFSVCSFDDVCIGIMICYDREYPESARELMLQGAELILVPNDCDNMRPRLRELSVRSH